MIRKMLILSALVLSGCACTLNAYPDEVQRDIIAASGGYTAN